MQFTSAFIMLALFALRATTVTAVPFDTTDVSYEARDVPEYELVFVRGFNQKMKSEQRTMNKEMSTINAEQQRLQTQQKDMSLQEQIHKDKATLRKDQSFSRRGFSCGDCRHESQFRPGPIARLSFESRKIKANKHRINNEMTDIEDETERLQTKQNGINQKWQHHGDEKASHRNIDFNTRSLYDDDLEELLARSQFGQQMRTEQRTMNKEMSTIQAQQQRLQTQQKDMSLQQQIHKDEKALKNNNAFVRRSTPFKVVNLTYEPKRPLVA